MGVMFKDKTSGNWNNISGSVGGEMVPVLDYNNAVQIPPSQLYSGYTIPNDGVVMGHIESEFELGMFILYINGIAVSLCAYSSGVNNRKSLQTVFSVVQKGNTITSDRIQGSGGYASSTDVHFIPWKKG